MRKQPLTYERLLEVLQYNPETGVFRWTDRVRKPRSDVVGGLTSFGYLCVQIDGRKYQQHRLAWLFVTGGWPPNEIDHVNLDKTDNRFTNLRLATRSQNCFNKRLSRTSISGYKGVTSCEDGKWMARCKVKGVRVYLGRYDTAEKAYEVYCGYVSKVAGPYANLG